MFIRNKKDVVFTGMHKADAFKILAGFFISYRIAEEDGRQYIMNDQFDPDRVNLYIKDNIVESYRFY